MQKKGFCNVECATQCGIERAQKAAEKKRRKEVRQARERLKTRSDYARDAQRDFNAYIRERDYDKPCISCGRHHQGQYHAGHYRTVGANPELRFEEINCHKQCAPCNNHKSGNIVEYRINLVERIGQEALDWLEGPHEPKKYTIDELKGIAKHYRQKARELKRKREVLYDNLNV
jgi:hypothetical protein